MQKPFLEIDGSKGEGGGQILRTSLALSVLFQQPIHIRNIRAKRSKPGLMRQHLVAATALSAVTQGELHGAELGSTELRFRPGIAQGGTFEFNIASAGSCLLVLQTLLPVLMIGEEVCELVLSGGTHNPFAPTFEFLQRAFLPLIQRMGPKVELSLRRPGFFPAGGGIIHARIQPSRELRGFSLLERGKVLSTQATARISALNESIARRELAVVRDRLQWPEENLRVENVSTALGPGNVLSLEISSEQITEVFTAIGERGVSAESVAKHACEEAEMYLRRGAPVGPHLADQLLLPLALSTEGGSFLTYSPTLHTQTQAQLLELFMKKRISFSEIDHSLCLISVSPKL